MRKNTSEYRSCSIILNRNETVNYSSYEEEIIPECSVALGIAYVCYHLKLYIAALAIVVILAIIIYKKVEDKKSYRSHNTDNNIYINTAVVLKKWEVSGDDHTEYYCKIRYDDGNKFVEMTEETVSIRLKSRYEHIKCSDIMYIIKKEYGSLKFQLVFKDEIEDLDTTK